MTKLEKISMFLLALYPILRYFVFVGQLCYGDIAGIIILMMSINKKLSVGFDVPKSYKIYWIYVAFQIYVIAGIGGWSDYFPGGVHFFLFSIFMFGFAMSFNLHLLYKYMRIFFVFASVILISQIVIYYTVGIKVSFFLPLGMSTTYGGMTYYELVEHQQVINGGLIERFSSVFAEPSHFGQYTLLLLSLELFINEHKNKLYTKFSIFIIIVLFLIQSGAGLLGLLFISIIKIIHIIFVSNQKKYILHLLILFPLVVIFLRNSMTSSAGAYVSERAAQVGNFDDRDQSSSTFVRLYYGWYTYGDMDTNGKIFGASRLYMKALRENGFFNGVTHVLCLQGFIGLLFLVIFYIECNRKNESYSIPLTFTFLIISLIGATYLEGLMMIVTASLLGSKNKRKQLEYGKFK